MDGGTGCLRQAFGLWLYCVSESDLIVCMTLERQEDQVW
jgi:hypothetical protein